MIFLTVVVERICLLLRKSAICPPIGTIIVITKCGTADSMPTLMKNKKERKTKVEKQKGEK